MKVDRGLIIRRLQVPLSMEYAQGCAESCEKHNLKYEFIDAVEFLDCENAFKSVGVEKHRHYKNTNGNCCVHSSMIKCWRRIIELGKPCIILEHDAIILGDVKTLDIPDMSVVSFGNHVMEIEEYEPIGPAQKLTRVERGKGCHAYSITPTTAQFLIDEIEEQGVTIGVDKRLMMKPTMPLYLCDPPQAIAWNRKSTNGLSSVDDTPRAPRIRNPKPLEIKSWLAGLQRNRNTV